jgi:hypothetical protein
MTWLAWRQQRTEALLIAAAIALLALLLVPIGIHMADVYDRDNIAACITSDSENCNTLLMVFQDRFRGITSLFNWLQLLPGILGALLAAPLVLELEQGTYRLAWTQSITRRRWLLTKLGMLAVGLVVASALLTVLLTWWRQPLDDLQGRFEENSFSFEGVVPYAYTLFGAALALAAGVVVRRVAPAFAIALVGFFAARFFVTDRLRPHFMDPLVKQLHGPPSPGSLHDAWVLNGPSLVDRNGNPPSRELVSQCIAPGQKPLSGPVPLAHDCLEKLGLYTRVEYHPASRFWTFQWIEAAIYLGAAAALAAFATWWILKRVS